MRRRAIVVFAAMALASCAGGSGPPGERRQELRLVGTCEDVEELFRDSLIAEMRERLEDNFRSATRDDCYDDLDYDAAGAPGAGDADADADPAVPDEGGDERGAGQYSTTNVQELGVDEADFIKNDGSHIYILSGNAFSIIDAWPPESAAIASSVTIDGTPQRLYVESERAVIYSEVDLDAEGGAGAQDCGWDEYGEYVCYGGSNATQITVLDIADRASPRLLREIVIAGAYVQSRRIGPAVHTVMSYPALPAPGISYWPEGVYSCDDRSPLFLSMKFAELAAANEQILREMPMDVLLPSMTDTRYAADGTPEIHDDLMGDCSGVYEATRAEGRDLLSIISFDLTLEEDVRITSIVGQGGIVYSSSEALYVATRVMWNDGGSWFSEGESNEATTIHRFDYDGGNAATHYRASGVVEGRPLNQFALSERDGDLRIATTTGYLPDPECHNDVYVLRARAGSLDVIGEVTGFGTGEDIRSVRFVGDRGYVVTFKKTDPLFVLDLSDPEQPTIEGELHIPGFSTYMHPMDDDHLLTIGFDAQDEGDFAWFQGIQLQIFDVSDMQDPQLAHRYTIGTRGSSSEATGNHLAFNYFAPLDLFAFPMAICEGGEGGGNYGDTMTFNGLLVFDVTTEDGFSEHGRIAHDMPAEEYPGDACSNWWQSPNSHVKRSIIMDDFVFSIASAEIIVANLDDLSDPVAEVALPTVAEPEEGAPDL